MDGFRNDDAEAAKEEQDHQDREHDQLPQSAEGIKQDLGVARTSEREKCGGGCWRRDCGWKLLLIAGLTMLAASVAAAVVTVPRGATRPPNDNSSGGGSDGGDDDSVGVSAALDAVEALLRSEIALEGGSEFDNPRSYQSRAKDALLRGTAATERSEQKLAQRYALLCFYHATNRVQTGVTDEVFGLGTVPKWRSFRHWKYHDVHECEWHGITCNEYDFVTGIDLTQNGLTGRIPPEITLLRRRLRTLRLDSNRGLGEGGVPWFLSEFGELTTLSLRGCSYAGEVPASLCGLARARGILDIEVDCAGGGSGGDGDDSAPLLSCSCCAGC